MTLRGKLLLAQVPLIAALAVMALASMRTSRMLGVQSEAILQHNFLSVLAAQRMKDAAERLDALAVSRLLGAPHDEAEAQRAHGELEAALRAEEGNITEAGEGDAAKRIRAAWTAFNEAERSAGPEADARRLYVERLRPALTEIRNATNDVLALNEDAMVRKNEQAQRAASRDRTVMLLIAMSAFGIGIFATATWSSRLLRPLSVVRQAVQRIGQGDLDARINLVGEDELSDLAREFNVMADRLRGYRQSSLGELLQAHSAAQGAIDALPDPVLVLNAKSQLLNVNAPAERWLGMSLEREHAGLEALPPELRAAVEAAVAQVVSGKGPYAPRPGDEPIRVQTQEGERFFAPRASPQYTVEGGVAGVTVVLQDVTRVRLFNELQNDMVATVAHEFRMPLTSLRMAIHLCLEELAGPLTEKQRELLQAGQEDSERLQDLVDDLLQSARLHAGKIGLERRDVPVNMLVDSAIATKEPAAKEAGIELRAEPVLEGVEVKADPDRAGLVFANLLENAIEHTPKGGRVELRVLPEDRFVRFEVVDTGPGIPLEYQQRVFEKFFQVPGTKSEGSGLGLYIARDLVRAHGGEIGLTSEPGSGSTFWFTLPRTGEGSA